MKGTYTPPPNLKRVTTMQRGSEERLSGLKRKPTTEGNTSILVKQTSTRGRTRKIWDATKSRVAPPARAASPTSVIPLDGFDWVNELAINSRPPPTVQMIKDRKKKTEGKFGGLMKPRDKALLHQAAPVFMKYATERCPVDVERNWSKTEILAAAKRWPHISALAPEAVAK